MLPDVPHLICQEFIRFRIEFVVINLTYVSSESNVVFC